MTYTINNAISFGTHLLAIVISSFIFPAFLSPVIPETLNHQKIVGIIAILLYLICGFFLKPVEKYSFLSVVSVMGLLLIVFVFSFMGKGERAGFAYLACNPVISLFNSTHSFFGSVIWIGLTAAIPSLLMYLGIVLRKLFASVKI